MISATATATAIGWGAILVGCLALGAGFIGAARARKTAARFDRLHGTGEVVAEQVNDDRRMAWPLPAFVRVDLARADLTPGPVLLVFVAAAVLAGLCAAPFGPLVAVPAAGIAALAVACVVHLRAVRRYNRIIEQLPAFVDRVRQYVITGASLQIAIPRAIESASPLLASVMAPVERRLGHGAGVPESIGWLGRRIASPELAMLAAAADANLRFGGQLGIVLANVVRMMRDRLRIGRELKAATSETRASALVLGLLPLVVAAAIVAIQPQHVMFFIEHPTGRKLLIIIIGLYIAGSLLMQRIAKPDY